MEKTNKKPVVLAGGAAPSFFGPVMRKLAYLFKSGYQASVSARGISRGGYPFHNHASKTFKKNQRVERKLSRRRKMKSSAR